VVVPKTAIPTLVAFTEKLARELDLVILTFGHAGDGNIHVNIMADRGDAAEWQRAGKAKKLLFEQVIALSGTLSGEHGIGITKAPYLSMEVEEESLELMRKIKRVFDPDNILNPGKIFTTAQEKP
jgi:glycolate oxidase